MPRVRRWTGTRSDGPVVGRTTAWRRPASNSVLARLYKRRASCTRAWGGRKGGDGGEEERKREGEGG